MITNLGFLLVIERWANSNKSISIYVINMFGKGRSYIFVDYNKFIYQV